jgi:hypothetical protein
MNISRIVYAQRSDTSAEMEVSALANVYQFALDRARKNAPGVTGTKGDDAKGSKNDRARIIIPR